MRRIVFTIAICLFFLSGCTAKFIDSKNILGKYEARYEQGTHTLILKEGGKYEDDFKYKNGKKLTHSGFWYLKPDSKEVPLLSEKALALTDFVSFGQHKEFISFVVKPVEHYESNFAVYQWFIPFSFGLIEIEIDPDGVEFYKVN